MSTKLTGTALREAVATRVMGLTRHDESYPVSVTGGGATATVQRFVWKNADGRVVYTGDVFLPKYESDIAAAFAVIEHARGKHALIEVITMLWGYIVGWQRYGDAPPQGGPFELVDAGTIKVHSAAELPNAICLAALAAMEARDA